jgi:hypothetical protein
MKHLLAFAIAAIAAVYAAPAGAATWQGVVVAKDPSRKAVATASPGGVVRTVRAPGRFAGLRIGRRFVVRARPLGDGTFAAAGLRALRPARAARVRAVVVQHRAGRYLVSAGRSTFALRSGARSLAATSSSRPGDVIDAVVSIAQGGLTATQVTTVGRVATVRIEGIVVEASPTTIRLVVARAGFVTVTVPAGLTHRIVAFDQVELRVAVGVDGSFTLVSGRIEADQADDDDDDDDEDDDDNSGPGGGEHDDEDDD